MERAQVPDAAAFRAFRQRCQDGSWQRDRGGLAVSLQLPPPGCAVHQLKCRIDVPDVPAETMYDVLHDSEYRRQWDSNVIDTHDIAQVAANADVGYYAWRCPKPLKNRDVVMLRAWQVEDGYHTIINFSIKHPKYPPRKDLVRAVCLLTGYLVHSTGPNSCSLTYLAQVDPKGNWCCWTCGVVMQILVTVEIWLISQECVYVTWPYPVPDPLVKSNATACYQGCWMLGRNKAIFWCNNFTFSPPNLLGSLPKWVVNKASQYLVPQMLKKLHKACVQYPAWKQQHNLNMKPWLYPEQNKLPVLALSELALQSAASLENIDESSLAEEKDESSEHGGLEN
ncbi:START domain-containing protein 10-like isoform X1 [Lagopus muta]|uniref:START domain-containing protein 10-like isoform X1 n=1 Tax=Lagopus muta TaxID=64668 RepID=UPI00209F4664|nr:START domain-containing protein 10-like isoform X1 [Lagopus muta]